MATARAPANSRGPPVHPGRCRYDSPGWQRYRPNRGDLLRGRRRAQAARQFTLAHAGKDVKGLARLVAVPVWLAGTWSYSSATRRRAPP
jgi:hypothetical protein